jgi:protein-S-isoprenylcysteine O-methyltransferase Ste14
MSSNTGYIFAVAAAMLGVLNALLLVTAFSSLLRVWPVPSPRSWQHYTFWPLFRGGMGLTLLYAIVTAHFPDAAEAPRFALGMIGVTAGFGFAIYGYFDLGIENTYGADSGLVTNGLYCYSRNPQYVASILGFFGTGLAHGGLHALILCGLAMLVYIVMPFTEEPWLERTYGEAYAAYKRSTPRFL